MISNVEMGVSIQAGLPWPSRVGLNVRSSIGALGSGASMNERMGQVRYRPAPSAVLHRPRR
jgi:hypothetical protein